MINTGPLKGSIEPLIQYLKIYRRSEEDSAKETTKEVDVMDENYDIDYPFDNTKLTVSKSSLTDLAVFRPLKDRMTFNSNDFLAIEVFDSIGQADSLTYYLRRVFNPTSNEPLVRYKTLANSDWMELDDSAFILIPLDQEEQKYLYNDEINRIVYNNILNTTFLYNDVFNYDPKDVGVSSGRYKLNYVDHKGNRFTYLTPNTQYTDYANNQKLLNLRNANVILSQKKEKVYLFPTIRDFGGKYILEYKYFLNEFSRFDIKHQEAAITIEFTYIGSMLYFLNRTVFYNENFDTIESKEYLNTIEQGQRNLKSLLDQKVKLPLNSGGIRQLFIDQYIDYVDRELNFYKKNLENSLEILYYTPKVFIKYLSTESIWSVVGKSLKGNVTNVLLDKEDITLKLLITLAEKINNPRLFLDELLIRKMSDNTSFFYRLFNKMNTSNFDKYIRFLWSVWKQTIYKDFTEENSKITSEGETLLNYKSDKTIGFHHDNASIEYLTESNKVQIDILTKVVKQATVKISGKDATIPFHTTLEKSLLYDPYAPIAILKEDNPHFIFKDEGSDKNAKFAILPAFVMLAREEKAFWSNVVTGAEYAIDIITTASGVLNILKAGRLFKILKAGHKLVGRTKGATNAITATKTFAGAVEVTAGIGNGLIKLLGHKDTELGRTIAKYLFFLEILSLSGELSIALRTSLSKTAKEIVDHVEFPKIKRQAEEAIKKADNSGASKKSKEVVEAEETLEVVRHLDEVSELDYLTRWDDLPIRRKGYLGGKTLRRKEIKFWIDEVIKISKGNSKLIIVKKSDGILKGNKAGFNPFNGNIYVEKGLTEYEIFHEFKHLEQFIKLGKNEYIKGMKAIGGSPEADIIRTYKREKYVFDEIIKAKHKFNQTQLDDAKRIIDDTIQRLENSEIDITKL